MSDNFHPFSRLPHELRHEIWHHALTACWSTSAFLRLTSRHARMVGDLNRQVGEACTEARATMQRVYTYVEPFGWINFDRHLFFFRSLTFDRGLMSQLVHQSDVFQHIKHLVLSPSDWVALHNTFKLVRKLCTSLETLVLVGYWRDPADEADSPQGLDAGSIEVWPLLITTSPTELDLSKLQQDIEIGRERNERENIEYLARLERIEAHDFGQDGVDNGRPSYELVRKKVRWFINYTREDNPSKPAIYFRRRSQVALPSLRQRRRYREVCGIDK